MISYRQDKNCWICKSKEKTPIWQRAMNDSDSLASGIRHSSVDEAVGCGSPFRDLAGNPSSFWATVVPSTCQTHLLDGLIGFCYLCHLHLFGLQPDFPWLPPWAHQCQHHPSVSNSSCIANAVGSRERWQGPLAQPLKLLSWYDSLQVFTRSSVPVEAQK